MPCECPGPRHEFISRKHLVDDAEVQGFTGREFLSRQEKISAAVESQQQGPHDVHAVARDKTAGEMGRVLEGRMVSGEDDVPQQGKLGVHRCRAVDGRDHRRLDLEQIHEQTLGVVQYLLTPKSSVDLTAAKIFLMDERLA